MLSSPENFSMVHFCRLDSDDPYGLIRMDQAGSMTYLIRSSQAHPDTAVSITYKTQTDHIYHVRVYLLNHNWYIGLDNPETGDREDYASDSLEHLMNLTFDRYGYTRLS